MQQTKHIVGPAACAALALELNAGGDPSVGEKEVAWALERVTPQITEILLRMPAREMGKSRLENLMFRMDSAMRT